MKLHFFLMRLRASIVITILFYAYAASDVSSSLWQPVQDNMRLRKGDYQSSISNEEECKTRCVATSSCLGVDWYTGMSMCFLFNDPEASPYSATGYRHWRLIRIRSTPNVHVEPRTSSSPVVTPATTTTAATATNAATATTSVTTETTNVLTTTTATTARTALATSPTGVRRSTPAVNSDKTQLPESSAPAGDVADFYLWQPEQLNTRSKTGDYQTGISDESGCKDRCAQNPGCIGIDWHSSETTCSLVYDCNASSYTEIGFSHSEIFRYKSVPSNCQDLVRRNLSTPRDDQPVSMLCGTQVNLSTVVKTLSVLLAIATVIIAALVFNTWRLHRKILRCACRVKVGYTKKAQENGYQSYNGTYTQPPGYTEMARSLPPIPYDEEILYADIDDNIDIRL